MPEITRGDQSFAIAALDSTRHSAVTVPWPTPGFGRYIHAAERFEYLEAHLAWFKRKSELLTDEIMRLRAHIRELETAKADLLNGTHYDY